MGEGGGELLMGRVLPGNSERGGLHWQLYLAGINGDSTGRTRVATLFGGPKWRLFWAGQFGDSEGRVNLASLFSGFYQRKSKGLIQEKQSNRKEK